MDREESYMVKRTDKLPTLLLITPNEDKRTFCLEYNESYGYIAWMYKPEFEDIVEHKERFPEYEDISNEEAKKIDQILTAAYTEAENKKHIIRVEHSQKSTEKGVVFIDTYTKDKIRPGFRTEDLVKLLTNLAEKDHMLIQKIDNCVLDYWGYRKFYTNTSKDMIPLICDNPLSIDGFFTDQEMNYRFIYIDNKQSVIIASCKKESGIDLHDVFDYETNRRASGHYEGE